jgi:NAD(P)-dependent dehydrogenase (short-subunit alcohol dehydrogenase family)
MRKEQCMNKDTGVVLVTGAVGNLGRAVARRFAADGRRLALLDRDAGQLAAAFGPDTGSRMTLACDLLDAAAVASAVGSVTQRLGPVGVLCNIAGGFRMGEPVHETSDATWDFLLNLNVRTVLHTARAVVPGMLAGGGGAIVSIGAGAALKGGANMGAYAASKSALIRLTESMAAELREGGVNVNCVLPSIIDTPENRKDMPQADPSRWVSPDELANVIAFLASPQAGAIHGASVPVSGLS